MPFALLFAGVLGLTWCATDHYRARVALFEIRRIHHPADVDWAPVDRPAWHRVDPPEFVEPYAELARSVAGEGETREKAQRLIDYVALLGRDPGVDWIARPVVPSADVDGILEDMRSRVYRGNCAHYSWIFQTFALAAGIDARFVAGDGDVWLDGAGHGFNEVYLPERDSWMIADAFFGAFFVDSSSQPLSTLELRELLRDDVSEVRVIQADSSPSHLDADEVLDFYAVQIDRLQYTGSANLMEARSRIYDSWLARVIRLESWPHLLRRSTENLLWSADRRYIYVDHPELDDVFLPQYVLRGSAGLVGAGILLAFGIRVRRVSRGKG